MKVVLLTVLLLPFLFLPGTSDDVGCDCWKGFHLVRNELTGSVFCLNEDNTFKARCNAPEVPDCKCNAILGHQEDIIGKHCFKYDEYYQIYLYPCTNDQDWMDYFQKMRNFRLTLTLNS